MLLASALAPRLMMYCLNPAEAHGLCPLTATRA
jgi:hypothetical protein